MVRDHRSRPFTDEQRALVRDQYPAGDLEALASYLGTNMHGLRELARRMGVKRVRGVAASGANTVEAGIVATALRRRSALEKAWN